ncbi:hypothetical protein CBS101457_004869 [Exobasidium rhododendri]|nr:hypothetical protein CBS101457_004869 [Exobasidium rhododendri]
MSNHAAVRINIGAPQIITASSCLQGTIFIDLSKLPAQNGGGANLIITLNVRRVHERWQYKVDKSYYPFLTCSSEITKMQKSAWTMKDTSLQTLKIGNKPVDLRRSREEDKGCAFSLTPIPLLVNGDEGEEGQGTRQYSFQLDGRMLNVDHLKASVLGPMERDVVMLSASLGCVEEQKSTRPSLWTRALFQGRRQASRESANTKTTHIKGATDTRVLYTIRQEDLSRKGQWNT